MNKDKLKDAVGDKTANLILSLDKQYQQRAILISLGILPTDLEFNIDLEKLSDRVDKKVVKATAEYMALEEIVYLTYKYESIRYYKSEEKYLERSSDYKSSAFEEYTYKAVIIDSYERDIHKRNWDDYGISEKKDPTINVSYY